MSYTFTVPDSPYFLAMLTASAMAGVLAWYVWRRRSSPGGFWFAVLMAAAAEWALMCSLEMMAPDLPGKILCGKLSYLGAAFLGFIFLMFALDYSHTGHRLKRKQVLLLAVVPVAVVGLVMTNEWHGLIWSRITLAPGGQGNMAIYEHGVAFWLQYVYTCGLAVTASAILVRTSLRSPGSRRLQTMIMLIGVGLVLGGSVLFISRIDPMEVDVIPFLLILAGTLYGWYIFRGRMFDIVTVAQRRLVASMADGVLVLDNRDRIVSVNPAARRLLGAAESEVGYSAQEVMAGQPGLLARCLAGGESTQEIETDRAGAGPQWLEARISTLNDVRGKPTGRLVVLRDVTERKRAEEQVCNSLQEKEVLLKEIHHRVKNNLQIISSLLSLQSVNGSEENSKAFRESQDRIKSMALIHEKLYQSGDLSRIDFADYVRSLATYLTRSYAITPGVEIDIAMEKLALGIDQAIPCGLIINELVSNSLKYAFPGGRAGKISISLVCSGRDYVLAVSDDGVGLPPGLDFRDTQSLGLQLVNTLVGQLEGTIDLTGGTGTAFRIVFKE